MPRSELTERIAPACPQALCTLETLHERIRAALNAVRMGVPVVLTDDHDREDEADLILAAERLSERTMAQLIRDGSGIVCLCLTDETIKRLQLRPMVPHNESAFGTAFTVTIEARRGVSTGVSARDRLTTIQAAIAPDAVPGRSENACRELLLTNGKCHAVSVPSCGVSATSICK